VNLVRYLSSKRIATKKNQGKDSCLISLMLGEHEILKNSTLQILIFNRIQISKINLLTNYLEMILTLFCRAQTYYFVCGNN